MLNYGFIVGRLGRDAEVKKTKEGKAFLTVAVATDVGYGESKSTAWVDVSYWGGKPESFAPYLVKGAIVAATGEISVREHNGKAYQSLRADKIKIVHSEAKSQKATEKPAPTTAAAETFDDDLPF